MEKLIGSNEMLIHKIKKNIDVVDIENDNDVHFQYIFNIKEGGFFGMEILQIF